MRHFLAGLWRSYARNERGNVFVLFGASAIPLLLVMGGAVDLARFARYKANLSNAVDSAALALARQGDEISDEEEAITFVTDHVAAFDLEDDYFDVAEFTVDETDNGYIVTADASMETIFLPLGDLTNVGGAVMSMDMDITAAVQTAPIVSSWRWCSTTPAR
jgi:Flp pilus assembly protein TadG